MDALVGRVTWINVSLNAATRATWRDVCGTDGFDRLCGSVAALRDAKRATGNVHPLLYGSAVVTRRVVAELPRLPALRHDFVDGAREDVAFAVAGRAGSAGPARALGRVGRARRHQRVQAAAQAAQRRLARLVQAGAPSSSCARLR